MKAITLTQPWATLVAIGAKMLETRSWTISYRGFPLAIHAAKGLGPGGRRAYFDQCYRAPFLQALEPAMTTTREIAGDVIPHVNPDILPRGAIVAVCWLHSIYRITEQGVEGFNPQPPANEIAFGDYSPGRFAWLLTNVRALPEPISAKGQLGLWEWQPPEGFEP